MKGLRQLLRTLKPGTVVTVFHLEYAGEQTWPSVGVCTDRQLALEAFKATPHCAFVTNSFFVCHDKSRLILLSRTYD